MSRHVLLFVCCTLMGVRPAAAEIVSDQVEDIDQVLILNAAKATLKSGTEAGTWQIILKPQAGNLVASSPTVAFRTVYGKTVSDHWTGWFEDKPTPAVLTWQDKAGDHGVVLEVDQPRYNTGTLRFTARVALQAGGTLASFSQYAGALPKQGIVKQAALYLDDTQARVIRSAKTDGVGQTINGCVIQPFTSCPGADLAKANLANAYLPFAILTGANLTSANLSSAILTGATLTTADLSFATLTGAGMMHINLSFANLPEANLTGAFLNEAKLQNAFLMNANLNGAYVNFADLSRANLNNALLVGTSLNGAKFCQTTMPNGSINNSGCQN